MPISSPASSKVLGVVIAALGLFTREVDSAAMLRIICAQESPTLEIAYTQLSWPSTLLSNAIYLWLKVYSSSNSLSAPFAVWHLV